METSGIACSNIYENIFLWFRVYVYDLGRLTVEPKLSLRKKAEADFYIENDSKLKIFTAGSGRILNSRFLWTIICLLIVKISMQLQ